MIALSLAAPGEVLAVQTEDWLLTAAPEQQCPCLPRCRDGTARTEAEPADQRELEGVGDHCLCPNWALVHARSAVGSCLPGAAATDALTRAPTGSFIYGRNAPG